MMKLLLGRVLPAGLTIGMLTGAISPLQPALDAFRVAANALAGDAAAGGVDMPDVDDLQVPVAGSVPNPQGFFARLFSKKGPTNDYSRREIAGLVEQLKAQSDQRAAENVAKMGKKDKGKAKAKQKPKADPPKPTEPAKPPEPAEEADPKLHSEPP
jgi:hypothetical protein